MRFPAQMLAFRSARLGLGLTLLSHMALPALCQEKTPHSILTIEDSKTESSKSTGTASTKATGDAIAPMNWTGSAPTKLTSSGKGPRVTMETDPQSEVVRDRYANGKLRVERRVTLDAEGNYVNHGEYRELSDKGELLVTGTYRNGQRTGVWAKFLSGTESPLFKSYPFNKLRPPFSSSVEFDADKMHGVWIISDRDKRIACQVELHDGQRHGTATVYHPNGQTYLQSSFASGVLDGLNIEKSPEGKVIHEDMFIEGRKLVVDTEHFANKSVKSVTRYLTGVQKVATLDDWNNTTLATYTTVGDKELHGEFVTYHDNGQVATKGNYEHGELHGPYESWYRTGDVAASGAYDHGHQDGDWIWRHANGMKRAVATYDKGEAQGEVRAWDDKGKALSKKELPNPSIKSAD